MLRKNALPRRILPCAHCIEIRRSQFIGASHCHQTDRSDAYDHYIIAQFDASQFSCMETGNDHITEHRRILWADSIRQ